MLLHHEHLHLHPHNLAPSQTLLHHHITYIKSNKSNKSQCSTLTSSSPSAPALLWLRLRPTLVSLYHAHRIASSPSREALNANFLAQSMTTMSSPTAVLLLVMSPMSVRTIKQLSSPQHPHSLPTHPSSPPLLLSSLLQLNEHTRTDLACETC